MLATLIISACLIAKPEDCQDSEPILISGGVSAAMQIVAEWASEHPGFRISSWKVRR